MFDVTDGSSTHLQAARLGALWNRLSSQHVALGCSCTMSGISVTLEDFELDIADYLWAESGRFHQRNVEDFLLAPGPIESQHQPIRGILERLESGQASAEVADWLLTRMTRNHRVVRQVAWARTASPAHGRGQGVAHRLSRIRNF